MAIAMINAGNNFDYPVAVPVSASSPASSMEFPYNSSEVVLQREDLPRIVLYRQRFIVYDESCLVMLSNTNMRISPDQGANDPAPYPNQLAYRYADWKETVSRLLDQGVRKGIFVNKLA
jgi:hypothetical protein